MRRILLVIVTTLSLLSGSTAHAGPARVQVSYLGKGVSLQGGDLVAALCEATADPGTTGHTVASTTVTCSLNGAYAERSLPGSKSYAVSANATFRPYELCFSATATFSAPSGTYDVQLPLDCVFL